jgi:carbon-monoxide dehydrogenase medium subunit
VLNSYTFVRAGTIDTALEAAKNAAGSALFLAGGTDLMVSINHGRLDRDRTLVYIGDIPEMKKISCEAGVLRIGSLVTAAALLESLPVKAQAAAVRMAAREMASPQVRNRATIGGNIAAASPSGDFITALIALGANVVLAGNGRRVPVEDVPIGVKRTSLGSGDMIERIEIQPSCGKESSAFVKIGKRKAMTISIANAACRLSLEADGTTIRDIRIAIGACAPTVVRAEALEAALKGKSVFAAGSCIHLAAEAISPITDGRATKWYRNEIVPILVHRSIKTAAAIANGGDPDQGVVL